MTKTDFIEQVKKYSSQWQTLEDIQLCVNSELKSVTLVDKTLKPFKVHFGGIIMATDVYRCDDGFIGVTAIYHADADYIDVKIPVTVSEYEIVSSREYFIQKKQLSN